MKILKKLLFVSIASSGLLLACPNAHSHSHAMYEKSPRGVLKDLYEQATLKQKRELLQIEYDAQKTVKKQTEKFKQYRKDVEFDIKNLYLDLEEAKMDRNMSKTTEILHRITNKQEEIRKSKQDEQNLRYLLEEDKIKKMNGVLKVK